MTPMRRSVIWGIAGMADNTAALELPIGVTENRVLQQVARIENQLRKLQGEATQGFVKSNAAISASFGNMSKSARWNLQNVSYQLQDIFVQIAGGQGAVRALSQQLPQLLGGFGAFGALAGVAVGAIGALAPMIFQADEKAKSFDDTVKGMNSALSSAVSAAKAARVPYEDLVKTYGNMADEARRALDGMAALSAGDAVRSVKALLSGDEGMSLYSDLVQGTNIDNVARGFDYAVDAAERLKTEYNLTTTEAKNLLSAFYAFNRADTLERQARAAAEFQEQMVEAYGNVNEMPPLMRQLYEAMASVVTKGAEFGQIDMNGTISDAAVAAELLAGWLSAAAVSAGQIAGYQPDLDRFKVIDPSGTATGTDLAPASTPKPTAAPRGIGGVDWGTPPTTTRPAGAGGMSKAERAAEQEYNGLLRERDRILNDIMTPMERYQAAVAKIVELGQTPDRANGGFLLSQEEVDAARQRLEELRPEAVAGRDAMNDLFGSILEGSDAAVQALGDLLMQIAKVQFAQGALGLLGGTSGGSWLINAIGSSLTMNANGGVYNGPGISAYSGQVVNKPTLFPFAKGTGLMGEAGPEAILPLVRAANGKLGVQAQGGGGSGGTHVTVGVEVDNNGNLQAYVKNVADNSAASMGAQINRALPARVQQINAKPRMR